MAKNTTRERLTEVITAVLTPSMRAHLDHACKLRGDVPYAYLIREVLRPALDKIDPLTPEQLKTLTEQWITDHPHGN